MSVLYCTVMYQVKYSTVVHRKVPIINGANGVRLKLFQKLID